MGSGRNTALVSGQWSVVVARAQRTDTWTSSWVSYSDKVLVLVWHGQSVRVTADWPVWERLQFDGPRSRGRWRQDAAGVEWTTPLMPVAGCRAVLMKSLTEMTRTVNERHWPTGQRVRDRRTSPSLLQKLSSVNDVMTASQQTPCICAPIVIDRTNWRHCDLYDLYAVGQVVALWKVNWWRLFCYVI